MFNKKIEGFEDGLWTRYKIGTELLVLLKQASNAVDDKNSHNPKGLLKTFDIIDSFNDSRVTAIKHIIQLKKTVFGKDFLDMCLMCAIEIHKKADIDIMKVLELDVKQMKALT